MENLTPDKDLLQFELDNLELAIEAGTHELAEIDTFLSEVETNLIAAKSNLNYILREARVVLLSEYSATSNIVKELGEQKKHGLDAKVTVSQLITTKKQQAADIKRALQRLIAPVLSAKLLRMPNVNR